MEKMFLTLHLGQNKGDSHILPEPLWRKPLKIYVQALLPTINVWTTQLISLPFVDRKTQVPHTRLSSSDVEMPSSQGLFEFLSSNDAYF